MVDGDDSYLSPHRILRKDSMSRATGSSKTLKAKTRSQKCAWMSRVGAQGWGPGWASGLGGEIGPRLEVLCTCLRLRLGLGFTGAMLEVLCTCLGLGLGLGFTGAMLEVLYTCLGLGLRLGLGLG